MLLVIKILSPTLSLVVLLQLSLIIINSLQLIIVNYYIFLIIVLITISLTCIF